MSDQHKPQTTNYEPQQTDVPVLELGKPIERELAGGEVHAYRITLASLQYLRVVVDQRGIDVVVKLFGPDGQQLAEMDSPNGTQGPEQVPVVAEVSGEYRLEVRSLEDKAASGRYEVRIEELRKATPHDRNRIAKAESIRRAIKKHEEARIHWQRVGDLRQEAEMLMKIGSEYMLLGDTQKGLHYYIQALQIFQMVGDRGKEAELLLLLGGLLSVSSESQKALDVLHQARTIFHDLGNSKMEAGALFFIGNVHKNTYENQKALDYYGKALDLYRTMGNHFAEASTCLAIGQVYAGMDDYHKAIEQFRKALPVFQNSGEPLTEASTLASIGNFYAKLGEEEIARDYYNHALSLYRVVGLRPDEARMLKALGEIYLMAGDRQKALDNLNRALAIFHEFGDRGAEADTYFGIGVTYEALGENHKAIDNLRQALNLYRTMEQGRKQAHVLTQVGAVYLALGEYQKALENLKEGLLITHAVGNRDDEAMALYLVALINYERGELIEARTKLEAALEITNSSRQKIANPEWRASFLASRQPFHELYIDLLMRLHQREPGKGHDAEALTASERARARSLLEILTEARVDIRQGVDPELLQRECELQQRLNAKSERQIQLRSSTPAERQAEAVKKELEALEKELAQLTTEYQEVQAQIRAKSPRYAALTQPQPLSLKEIQQQVLDEDMLLLEYALGEERSFLWAVTPTSIKSYELPKRAEIEAAARQAYDLMTKSKETAARGQAALSAARLSQMILGPVADQLGKKRLLIVADGALQYIPFAALPAPKGSLVPGHLSLADSERPRTNDKGRMTKDQGPLIVDHEIVSLPSASVLAVLRRELAGRQTAPKLVAVLADPVFEKNDPRVKATEPQRHGGGQKEKAASSQPPPSGSTSSSLVALPSDVERAARDAGLMSFKRLQFTRQEAEAITALIPEKQRLTALDFEASRGTVTNADLSQYRLVHVATHGLLNSVHPELSGLVLSLMDEKGQPQDGFLRLHEVYNLKLNADLVVLSACQTALGKEVKGEGLVGLTRGFMYAGAARVLVSLWNVSDEATAELMRRFYHGMLREGLRPAAALRAAQVSMSKEQRWSAPYFWAGFVLQGEWRNPPVAAGPSATDSRRTSAHRFLGCPGLARALFSIDDRLDPATGFQIKQLLPTRGTDFQLQVRNLKVLPPDFNGHRGALAFDGLIVTGWTGFDSHRHSLSFGSFGGNEDVIDVLPTLFLQFALGIHEQVIVGESQNHVQRFTSLGAMSTSGT
jgi:CHAT domain-containing protein/Tfp pilus assembly protein PilF